MGKSTYRDSVGRPSPLGRVGFFARRHRRMALVAAALAVLATAAVGTSPAFALPGRRVCVWDTGRDREPQHSVLARYYVAVNFSKDRECPAKPGVKWEKVECELLPKRLGISNGFGRFGTYRGNIQNFSLWGSKDICANMKPDGVYYIHVVKEDHRDLGVYKNDWYSTTPSQIGDQRSDSIWDWVP